jgi:hypothetical protein
LVLDRIHDLKEGHMRSFCCGVFICALIVTLPGWGQQAVSTQTQSPAPKDPQALSVANQALAVAGGTTALLAIADYAATGTITYHENADVQGTVLVRGLGLGEYREDATLPTGVRAFAISNGQAAIKTEDGLTRKLSFNYQVPLMRSSLVIPYRQLAAALNDSVFSLSYKGVAQIDGQTVHDLRVQMVLPGTHDPNGVIAEYMGMDFFIDTTTFQVVTTQDVVSPHRIRKIRYSDYRSAGGVVVPFLIDEEVGGQHTQTIHLDQIGFNTALQDSAFELQ